MAETCCSESRDILILACAGAANVGQLSNQVAIELTREGFGRLFCLAGIAAHRSGFVRSAKDAEDMLVLDGCPIGCAKKILEHTEIPLRNHFILTEMGIEKSMDNDLPKQLIDKVKEAVKIAMRGA